MLQRTLERIILKVIHETLPVYKDRFAVTRDVVFAQQKELATAAGSGKEISMEGAFRYQACDDKECYLPESIPLK
jgi:hypothetical protein